MKYCPYCKRWNIGDPLRCRFCGRTWQVRVCSAGHINPADVNICGECGRSDLSEPAGRTPIFLRLLKLIKPLGYFFIILLGIRVIIGIIGNFSAQEYIGLILPIAILILAMHYFPRILGINILGILLRFLRKFITHRRDK